MSMDLQINEELRHRIPKIVLDLLDNVEVSVSEHLKGFQEVQGKRLQYRVRVYVENRIKQEIFECYKNMTIKPKELDGRWAELISEYSDAADIAEDTLRNLSKVLIVTQ